MADKTGLQFTLTLPGADDTAVVRFTHREALSEPFALSVEFASRTHDLSPSDCLDQNATLTVWQDGEPLRRVHGIIAELHRGDRGHRRSFYRVEIRPALWRLSLRHNSRIFQDTSPFDAITTLANERSLTDIGFATTRTPLDREFLVQYRETDLAFIERLAAEEGCFYFHEFENAEGGKHQLVFADATVVLPSVGERTYHSRAGGTPPRRHLRKLRQANRVRPASAMLKDYTFKNPPYAQIHEHLAPGLGEHAQREDYEHFDYPGRYKKDASGKPFTRHRLESLRADAITAEAESDLPELAPGICFTLTDHDIDSLNRAWQVVSVVHQGEQPQALEEDGMARGNNGSSAQSGELMTRYHNDVVIMPKDQTFRPVPNPKPRVDGPQVAFVVGPEGEEIYCDEHGRVKVQFPWDRYAEPNETASCWIRVAQSWAGGGYGSMAIPRIGHEVIVSFLEGDPDQPLVTGRTYHAVNTPPYPLPEHKTRTVIRTQSHKSEGFNELRFEDATGEEQIWLHAQKDLELLTLNDRTEEIRRDSHLKLHRNRLSEIHNDDHLTVHGKRYTQIKGDDHLQVDQTRHEVYGEAQLVETGRELHHKAGSQIVLEAGSEITLKAGGSFIKLDPGGVTIVGPQVKINSGGSPGRGQGQAIVLPRLPGEAEPEESEDVTLEPHQTPLLSSDITAATPLALDDIDITDGLADDCSACQPAVGSPVNPLLGAKLLPAETDFALPAPRPFVFSRGYLSSNGRIGVLGQGWSVPGESLVITLSDDACIVHDAQGRQITFGALAPGQARFSPTEQLWIRRGGASADGESNAPRWHVLDETLRQDPERIVLSDASGLYYVFANLASAHPADVATTSDATSGNSSSDNAARWSLIEERDRNGYATQYHWEAGLLVTVIDSAQRRYQFVYDSLLPAQPDDAGQRLTGVKLVQAHDGSAQDDWLVRYSFSPVGDLIAVRHRHGEVVREFEWQDHMLTAHRVPGGMEAHYTWDRHAPDGRVVGQQEAGGLARSYSYQVDHTLVTDSLGREERYHFVGSGPGRRWTAHTRTDGSRIEFRYDRAGLKVATVDPLGHETLIERDEHGQVIAQTGPDGTRWAIERDPLGQPVSIEGPEDQTWQITRNEQGLPVEVTGPEGTTAFAYEHDALPDRPTTITDAGGATHQREWNALGQVTAQIDCSQQRIEYAYDRHGYLASVTNALGETTRTQHDEMGRRLATQLPDGTHWHHHVDALGRLVELEGPQGFRQQFFFDDHGRPVQRIEADGSQQFTAYDDVGRLSELTLGNGAVYRFTYDEMDRLASETGPDGREQQYRYDDAGRLIERIEANRPGPNGQPLVTRYDYDNAGRLTARHLPATEHAPASTEQYQWGTNGQLLSVTNDHGEVSFNYDHAQRLIGEQQSHADLAGESGWQWQHQHTLTANGAPEASQFGDLPALNWHTYGSGHLHGLSAPGLDLEIALEPDALHRETQRRLSSSEQSQPLILERGYTHLGQLDHLTLRGANSAASEQQYQYDALGRMSFRNIEGDQASKVIAYSYDAAGRLIGSQHGDHAHRYSVDAAGNRLEPQDNQQALPDNRLTQLNGARYHYDGAGNLIERQQPNGERLTLGYDGANRLVHLIHASELGATREATYRYDGLGRRISKTVRHTNGTTATTHYGWDGDRIVREETDNQRATVVYEPGSFVPMLRIDDTEQGQVLSAYITDALGTPMQLVTPNGQPRWLAEPDDWAAVKNQRAVRNVTQPIRFQGQWHDEESGLYYNRHRYYDPQQGRYISQDPIGLNGGTNFYGYVTNPTGMVDPLGLFDRPGDIDQSGRRQRSNPYSRYPPAPRARWEKIGNAGLSKVWGKVTGGFSEIDTATGAIIKSNPYIYGALALIKPNTVSIKQSRYYDLDGDGLSDRHFEAGMCVPGEN